MILTEEHLQGRRFLHTYVIVHFSQLYAKKNMSKPCRTALPGEKPFLDRDLAVPVQRTKPVCDQGQFKRSIFPPDERRISLVIHGAIDPVTLKAAGEQISVAAKKRTPNAPVLLHFKVVSHMVKPLLEFQNFVKAIRFGALVF